MKKRAILLIILGMALFLAGCSKIENIPAAKTVVRIERTPLHCPIVYFAYQKAELNYEDRCLVIEGLISISGRAGTSDSWVVGKMEIKDNKLFIYIPSDVCYTIRINKLEHTLQP